MSESLNAELSLGQKRIDQLKQYLDFANRISDIMYETATLMCGEIQNHNPDNILFNYLNNDKDN